MLYFESFTVFFVAYLIIPKGKKVTDFQRIQIFPLHAQGKNLKQITRAAKENPSILR